MMVQGLRLFLRLSCQIVGRVVQRCYGDARVLVERETRALWSDPLDPGCAITTVIENATEIAKEFEEGPKHALAELP